MYLLFDTETNGLGPAARMAQLAFILYDENGNILEKYCELIKPDGWKIPKEQFFIDNNMSTERCEAEGVDGFEAMRAFQEALKRCQYKVAHNIQFDKGIINTELRIRGIEPALFKYKKECCTMLSTVQFVGALNKWGKPGKWPNLQELHNKCFGESFDGAHDALADVEAMGRCFFELKNKHGFYLV